MFNAGTGWGSEAFREYIKDSWQEEEELLKALTVGTGIVDAGDTGGRTLRTQFIPHGLEQASFTDEDAATMKMIPKEKAYSTAVEQTFNLLYGGPGSGFIGELGLDGSGNINNADDSFLRQVQNTKYMGVQRTPSFSSQKVRTVQGGDAMAVSEMDAMLEILGKSNRALFYADSNASINEWNGLSAQLRAWAIAHTERQACCYDAGGQPLGEDLMRDIQKAVRKNYGRHDIMICPVDVRADAQKLLFPKERFDPDRGNLYGIERDTFAGDWRVQLLEDVMLLPNAPLAVDGPRANGLPVTTGDAGAPAFALTPFNNVTAVAAGTRFFLDNADGTSKTTGTTTAPALPSGVGNQGNRLPSGSSYYACAPIYDGLEGPAWVNGASAAGTVTGATATTQVAGDVIRVRIDNTSPAITGLGSTWNASRISYRLYRYDGSTAPTSLSQFNYLATIGCPGSATSGTAASDSYYWDNGVDMPGTYRSYGITQRKRGRAMWGFLSLLPMIKRELPNTMMTDPFGVLLFGTPMLWVPHLHVEVRNIGAYNS